MDSEVVSVFFAEPDCPSSATLPNSNATADEEEPICDKFLNIVDELNTSMETLKLPPTIDCIYNPTIYARHTFELYVRKYCNSKKSIMYFGMNPGPWGMSQTGVPFGEVSSVRDWLGIEGPVGKPPKEIPARPVKGFDCPRTEVSGKRFWGLFKKICGIPEKFFKTSFVYNYIPMQWMKKNGCNITPGDFKNGAVVQGSCVACLTGKMSEASYPRVGGARATKPLEIIHTDVTGPMQVSSWGGARFLLTFTDDCTRKTWGYLMKHKSEGSQMEELFSICDNVFVKVLELYEVETVVAIGKFCETRAQKAIHKHMSGNTIKILYLPHPSPRAVNNQNWDQKAIDHLKNLHLLQYYQYTENPP